MTDATQIVPIRPSSPLPASEKQALAAELAKCLKLVAPANMGAEQQTVWLHAAVDALEDIRPSEVAAISAELRRSVTRPAQIVPEIAKLVAEKRSRVHQAQRPPSPYADEMRINAEGRELRAKARTIAERNEVWEWERSERIAAGLHVEPRPAPMSREELAGLPTHIREMGLKAGFLRRVNGELVEA